MKVEADCVIVGGGIGGAVLALALGRRGKQVIILEKELVTRPAARPEVLASATIDTFQRLGAGERILKEAALPLRGLKLYQSGGKSLLSFSAEDFKRYQVQPYSTDPARTREILLETAVSIRCVEVRRGVNVKEFLHEGDTIKGVRAESAGALIDFHAPLVVGDDGGNSFVRKALGIELQTREFPLDFLGTAGKELPGMSPGVGEAWIEPRGLKNGIFGGVFMPQPSCLDCPSASGSALGPGGRTAFVFLLSARAQERFLKGPPQDFYEAAKRFSPRCEGLEKNFSFPQSFVSFHRPFGLASRYVANGAVIMGDAAHPITPAGGQGANGSVADAVALAGVALQAFQKNDFSARQLVFYEGERKPANARSIGFSVWGNRIFRAMGVLPASGFFLTQFLGYVSRSPEMRGRFIRSVSNAFRSDRGGDFS